MQRKANSLLKIMCIAAFLVLPVELLPQATRGEGTEQTKSTPANLPGKDVLMNKCFQCHNDGMWRDLKLERKGWEGVLYRMVGRGALWTEDEINRMAASLTTAFGPKTAKTPPK